LNGFKQLYGQMALVYFELPDAREHSRRFYSDLLQATADVDQTLVEELTRKVMSDSCELWWMAAGERPLSKLKALDELGADAVR
jgi:hypothetical protein